MADRLYGTDSDGSCAQKSESAETRPLASGDIGAAEPGTADGAALGGACEDGALDAGRQHLCRSKRHVQRLLGRHDLKPHRHQSMMNMHT